MSDTRSSPPTIPFADVLHADPDARFPSVLWWTGPTRCGHCGAGTPGHARPYLCSTIPMHRRRTGPPALQCPSCRHMTLVPVDDADAAGVGDEPG